MSLHPSPALVAEDILMGADLAREQKRHGTLFPSKLDLTSLFRRQAQEEEDDYSTWEFHAPAHPLPSRPRLTADALISPAQKMVRNFRISESMSAAQRIAYQYRAGLKIAFDDRSMASSSRSSPTVGCLTLVESEGRSVWDICSEDVKAKVDDTQPWLSPVDEPRLRHSESRAGALAEAEKEALREIKLGQIGVVCPRKDCRETLSDVRALACHLSLHDIEKSKPYFCPACDTGFDKRHALNAHTCPARSRSAPSSPLFASFHHVLSRIKTRD
ncbi:hypothetical protein D9757_004949 [Collybiopsis confluens]|uniref:C2H2-type domain-containing protein n=1 Tax=Collybiopsis confluens TaxID=2823264 RepID=A0A8H5GUZ9_9AGAR|nr:hypothetical protein D9757_010400 [Collybiopsis confluens]KAF5389159.1 hypothetical protein D9757_004949 [Collybiopsis confluens]